MASEKVLALVESVKELTVLELNDLVKALEEEFGMEMEDSAAQNVKSVGDLVNYIEAHIK